MTGEFPIFIHHNTKMDFRCLWLSCVFIFIMKKCQNTCQEFMISSHTHAQQNIPVVRKARLMIWCSSLNTENIVCTFNFFIIFFWKNIFHRINNFIHVKMFSGYENACLKCDSKDIGIQWTLRSLVEHKNNFWNVLLEVIFCSFYFIL